jgi:hypothetical protein
MACLCGGESRRWTVAELLERFKNLGICASRGPLAGQQSVPARGPGSRTLCVSNHAMTIEEYAWPLQSPSSTGHKASERAESRPRGIPKVTVTKLLPDSVIEFSKKIPKKRTDSLRFKYRATHAFSAFSYKMAVGPRSS